MRLSNLGQGDWKRTINSDSSFLQPRVVEMNPDVIITESEIFDTPITEQVIEPGVVITPATVQAADAASLNIPPGSDAGQFLDKLEEFDILTIAKDETTGKIDWEIGKFGWVGIAVLGYMFIKKRF